MPKNANKSTQGTLTKPAAKTLRSRLKLKLSNRGERLVTWAERRGITSQRGLLRALGDKVDIQTVRRALFSGGHMHVETYRAFLQAGCPESALAAG